MPNQNDARDGLKLTDRATLSLLAALEDNSQPTQRGLAQRIGVALGMTNSLLKRAVRKGLVKVKNAPAKRYVYYVTPKGFSEKSRLVAEYLSTSLTFFRQARDEYSAIFSVIQNSEHKRIALCGSGELAEIAILSAHQNAIELGGVIEPGSNQPQFAGVPIYSSVEAALVDGVDVVVVTGMSDPQGVYDSLVQQIDEERVFVAPLLHINRNGKGGEG